VPPWDEVAVPAAIATLDRVTAAFAPFPLTFEHVAYGPQKRRPRLLWAACAVSDEIAALHAALLAAFGQSEERPFRPHVTLARIRGNGATIARRHPMDQSLALIQSVESVELFQSPPPGDNGYRILVSSRLGAIIDRG
jgi:2'-5' RNA ligase